VLEAVSSLLFNKDDMHEAAASDAGADVVAAIREEWHARAGGLGNAGAAAATAAADPASWRLQLPRVS